MGMPLLPFSMETMIDAMVTPQVFHQYDFGVPTRPGRPKSVLSALGRFLNGDLGEVDYERSTRIL